MFMLARVLRALQVAFVCGVWTPSLLAADDLSAGLDATSTHIAQDAESLLEGLLPVMGGVLALGIALALFKRFSGKL